MKPTVILDTDIGGDIDDSWALLYLLKLKLFDLKLIVSELGSDSYRLRLASKILELTGENAALGKGAKPTREDWEHLALAEWLEGSYNVPEIVSGIDRMIEIIKNSEDKVYIICIGGLTNIAKLFTRYPDAVQKTVLYLMGGRIYDPAASEEPFIAEANIAMDIKAAKRVFALKPQIVLFPFIPSKDIIIAGENYKKLRSYGKKDVLSLLDSYYIWEKKWISYFPSYEARAERETSSLYDVMPVFALAADFDQSINNPIEYKNICVRITDEGYTIISDKGLNLKCGIRISDIDALTGHVTDVLLR